ncbi:MAG TPA: TIGR02265 family protein [Archangium sp.]|jgi:uncharacterized protein (TIGR02265 family)|uniref:TIGR02265 family protein n=1 Tax=Archangium sp. TaxID=1872627 RepID=UPI002ED8505C
MSAGDVGSGRAPDAWAQELTRRQALATPADTLRGMFLRGTLEAIRELGNEALVKRCREACAHENFVELFNYPVQLQLQIMAVALEALAVKHGSCEEALRLLGRKALSDFLASKAGKMLLVVSGGEVSRLLNNAPTGYRVSTSYGEHTLRWVGPTSCQWTMKRQFMPHPFEEGVLAALLENTRARNVRVVGRQTGALDSEYDISWE